MDAKPCVKCKSTNIAHRDCGYSSFNPHWVECKDCGHKGSSNSYGKRGATELWNTLWEDDRFLIELQEMRATLESLTAIVGALPRCNRLNDDETALVQDVVIIRPTPVWILGGIKPRREETNGSIAWSPAVQLIGGGFVDGSRCYNSLAAAELAKEQAEKGTE